LERSKKAEIIEETRGLQKLKPLAAFTRESILLAMEQYCLEKGDWLFLEDASGGGRSTVELLREKEIAGVVVEGELRPALREHFQELCIPVFSRKNVPVQRINKMPFVRPEDVAAASVAWEEEMKARLARQHEERLEGIFQEYKVERKKEEKRKQKLARESPGSVN